MRLILYFTMAIAISAAKPAAAAIIGPGGSGIVSVGDALILEASADAEFTHTYSFGYDIGPPSTSVLEISDVIDLVGLVGSLEGPTLPNPLTFTSILFFPAIDTGSETPYTLTITGTLLSGADIGSYDGSISVRQIPEPSGILLFGLGLAALLACRLSQKNRSGRVGYAGWHEGARG